MYNAGWDREHAYRLLSSIKHSTEIRALGDAGDGQRHNGTFNFESAGNWIGQFPFTRHRGKTNAAFFDGHAETVPGARLPTSSPEYTFQPFWDSNPTDYVKEWDPGYSQSKVIRP